MVFVPAKQGIIELEICFVNNFPQYFNSTSSPLAIDGAFEGNDTMLPTPREALLAAWLLGTDATPRAAIGLARISWIWKFRVINDGFIRFLGNWPVLSICLTWTATGLAVEVAIATVDVTTGVVIVVVLTMDPWSCCCWSRMAASCCSVATIFCNKIVEMLHSE